MRRTLLIFAAALASVAAAFWFQLRPAVQIRPLPPPPAASAGALRMQALLERQYFPDDRRSTAYLQIDLVAGGDAAAQSHRVPVNAVLILDRSGSMSGVKIERARDAARALVQALGPGDRLSIVEFSSGASVLLRSTPVDSVARSRALSAIEELEAMGGTNLGAAFEAAGPQLELGRGEGRVDKVFLASDGQANEGVADRGGLLKMARRVFGTATLSTFGIGNDYDEDLMASLAAQGGGRARYVDSPEILPGAFRAELGRAAALVARNVRVRVAGLSGASVERVVGYEGDGGWVRIPDFAAGEERRVVAKLVIPPGSGVADVAAVDLAFENAAGQPQVARVLSRATFTADATLLGQPATQAAATGAAAEMAELAQQAAQSQGRGDRRRARMQLDGIRRLAMQAVQAAPMSAAAIVPAADEYERLVKDIDAPGDGPSKKLNEKAFDAVRAPVGGW